MKKASLTEGPEGRLIIKMIFPLLGGILSMITFTLVDTYFIARLGTQALAAVSFTFPIAMVLIYFIMGVGVGAASIVARAIGSQDHERVKRFATDGLLLGLLFVAVEIASGLMTMDILFPFLGARGDVIILMKQYMSVWYIAIGIFILSMISNSIIRSTGDVKFPSIIMAFSALINLVLDPILIFGLFGVPAFGIRGAAIATLIAFVISLAALGYRQIVHYHLISFKASPFKTRWESWKAILYIGVPSGMTNVFINLAMVFIMRLLATFGESAVAGFGVAIRVEELALALYQALGASVAPMVGQNWGAHKFERVKRTLRLSFKVCYKSGLILAVMLAYFAEPIARVFDDNPMVIFTASLYLLIVPFSYGLRGIMMMVTTSLNALGKPVPASIIALGRTFALYIPLAYLLDTRFGIMGIFIAAFIANALTGAGSYFWNRHYLKKLVRLESKIPNNKTNSNKFQIT